MRYEIDMTIITRQMLLYYILFNA